MLLCSNGNVIHVDFNPDRICKYVFVHGGFSIEYSTIQAYTDAIHRNPSLHHEFLQCRGKYVRMKNSNPKLVLRGKDDLKPARIVQLVQTQDIQLSINM